MKVEELRWLLGFVTGISVLTSKEITVTFNNLTGVRRRPLVTLSYSIIVIILLIRIY